MQIISTPLLASAGPAGSAVLATPTTPADLARLAWAPAGPDLADRLGRWSHGA